MNFLLRTVGMHRSMVLGSWLFLAIFSIGPATAGPGSNGDPVESLSLVSTGHLLRFQTGGYIVAAPTHTLAVRFVEANSIAPLTIGEPARNGTPSPLSSVTYRELWDGITLAYDAPAEGIVRSTFTLRPGAEPGTIRLSYASPVEFGPDGGLTIPFGNGRFHESAPIAWQRIDGQRVAVPVSFELREGNEVGFAVGNYDPEVELVIDPVTTWNTFLGGSGDDYGNAIHIATNGDITIVGSSDGTWGSPILPYSATYDVFVARLDSTGTLVWNTFLGGTFDDYGNGLAVDANGTVFVSGLTEGPWTTGPTPVSPYVDVDGFVARLDSDGNLIWRTYTGGNGAETCTGIALSGSGNLAVTGFSDETWGSPLVGHGGGTDDGFVFLLSSSGSRIWSTFLGGSGANYGECIAVDGSGAIYIAGSSDAAWGSAVRSFTGLVDGFVARLTSIGSVSWNTFLGGNGNDAGFSIFVDGNGSLFTAGSSTASWGTPVRAYTPSSGDGYVAKLASTGGALLWNTFLGGSGDDTCEGIVVDGNGNLFVAGASSSAWASPVQGYSGGASDAYVANLNPDGALAVNTFLGSTQTDRGAALAVDSAASVYLLGRSNDSWGTPVRPYTTFPGNNYDAFVAMVDIAAPTALWFALDTPATSPTNADALIFDVAFSEPVLDVTAVDFVVAGTTAMITDVTPVSPNDYTVTVSGGDLPGLNGDVGLDFAAAVSITDLAGNVLAGDEPLLDEVYTLDNIAPDVTIDPPTPADPTASASASFIFSSSDATAVFECDLDGAGFVPTTSPKDYVGLSDGPHTFTLHALDEAGNVGTAIYTWTIDLTPPSVTSIVRANVDPTSAPVVDFTVSFSEAVAGVDMGNFALATTGVAGAAVTAVTGVDESYTVTVSTGSGVGTIRLDLAGIGTIADGVGNLLAGTFTGGEFYTIVSPDPQFVRGDANSDFSLNIADAIFVLAHLFSQGSDPTCRDTADANDDGNLNIADAIKLLDFLFSQGPPLPEPTGACGVDPTPDALDCGDYVFCQP